LAGPRRDQHREADGGAAGGEADQPSEERGLAAEQVGELAAGQLGCSISQPSASVMTEAVIGKTVRDAMDISGAFLELMQSRGEAVPDEDVLGDAVAFEGVSKHPARIKCALLSWMAWKDATARALDGTGHARDGEITAD
jgi:nitrogen fixation protein NifU and related proteins